jgi:hypothetical protein
MLKVPTLVNGCAAPHAAAKERSFVLLAGTPRSGTTWLANILNSHPRSLYSHEPLSRLSSLHIEHILDRVREGEPLSAADRNTVLDDWSNAYPVIRRAPFFRKSYGWLPHRLVWACWLAVQMTGRGHAAFRKTFSPPGGGYDLVVKQGGLSGQIIQSLRPDRLVIIVRHPCGVAASLMRGQRMGLMDLEHRAEWLKHNQHMCDELGYSAREIKGLSACEFCAVKWLTENLQYHRAATSHPNCRVVVYEELCSDPLLVSQSLFEGLEWKLTPQTIRFIEVSTSTSFHRWRTWLTARNKYFSVYRFSGSNSGAWRNELSADEQRTVMRVAGSLWQELESQQTYDSDSAAPESAEVR